MLVQLLNSPSDDVRKQAVWALSYIAGDSPKLRDEVLKHNATSAAAGTQHNPHFDAQHRDVDALQLLPWQAAAVRRPRQAGAADARLINSNDKEVLTDA